jgi:hypothetical protein
MYTILQKILREKIKHLTFWNKASTSLSMYVPYACYCSDLYVNTICLLDHSLVWHPRMFDPLKEALENQSDKGLYKGR